MSILISFEIKAVIMNIMFLMLVYFVGCFCGQLNVFFETKLLRNIKDKNFVIKRPVLRVLLFGTIFILLYLIIKDFSKSSYIFTMFFVSYLIAMVDLKGLIIPNKLIVTILLVSGLSIISGLQPTGILESLIGLLFGFLMLAIPYFLGAKIGGGDVKLLAVIGLCVGYMGVAYIMVLVGILLLMYVAIKSLITKKHYYFSIKDMLPMGPFITASFMLFLFAQGIGIK